MAWRARLTAGFCFLPGLLGVLLRAPLEESDEIRVGVEGRRSLIRFGSRLILWGSGSFSIAIPPGSVYFEADAR